MYFYNSITSVLFMIFEVVAEAATKNTQYAHFIQFIKNQGPLHVSSVTCSYLGGATQAALGILRAEVRRYLKVLTYGAHILISARSIPSAACLAPPEDEKVMLETCRDP
jgi:hypothetical protein